MLLYLIYDELHDMWRNYRIRRSLRGYLGIWNTVDWFKLVVSVIVMLWWWQIVEKSHAVSDLVMQLPSHEDPTQVDIAMSIHQEAYDVGKLLGKFRMLMVVYTASIILAFFKAFQANPRLNLVTKTILVAASDLLHFGIVFSSIFIAFAFMGYLIFGLTSPEFASLDKS